jgi:N-acetylmuramoyl-L-alanine amidase
MSDRAAAMAGPGRYAVSRRRFLVASAALAAAGLLPRPARGQAAPVVAIDPGHGGIYNGSSWSGGRGLMLEKHLALDVALRLAELLNTAGLGTVLTRDTDGVVNVAHEDLNEDGRLTEDDDLQARVDVANAAEAALMLSVHFNGGPPLARGTSTFYCLDHPRGKEARLLAGLLQAEFLEGLFRVGYVARDLGAMDDVMLNKPYGHLFLAGPRTPRVARPSAMPTVVGEPLFLSNPAEAELVRREDTRQALAEAYCRATLLFLGLPV